MTAARHLATTVALVFAVPLHLIVGWFHFTAGLVAPGWAVLLLVAEWAALAWLLWRWRRMPARVLAIPFLSAAVWFAVLWVGGEVLGWTA